MGKAEKILAGVLVTILMGLSTWTLTTVITVKEASKIHEIRIADLKEDLGDIESDIKALGSGSSNVMKTNQMITKLYEHFIQLEMKVYEKPTAP